MIGSISTFSTTFSTPDTDNSQLYGLGKGIDTVEV